MTTDQQTQQYIEGRISELKAKYKKIEEEHDHNAQMLKYNPDSIKAIEQVIRDENSGYICEVWGRLNELEKAQEHLAQQTKQEEE